MLHPTTARQLLLARITDPLECAIPPLCELLPSNLGLCKIALDRFTWLLIHWQVFAMLPDLTHLQFSVLTALMGSRKTGRHLREELAQQGVKKSLAAFYQLMSRLEDADMVRGWYEPVVVDGYTVKERHYEITGLGQRCWQRTRDFYAEAALRAGMPLEVKGVCS